MIYTLAIMLIFTLFLQFFLMQHVESRRNALAEKKLIKAQIMMRIASQKLDDGLGEVVFDQGVVKFTSLKNQRRVEVTLTDGSRYQF